MNTFLARVPSRSTTVISPSTAKAERAYGSPVEGAAQRGRADVGRSALPLDSAVAVASALVGQAREWGSRVRSDPTQARKRRSVPARSFLAFVFDHQRIHELPASGIASVGTAGCRSGGRIANFWRNLSLVYNSLACPSARPNAKFTSYSYCTVYTIHTAVFYKCPFNWQLFVMTNVNSHYYEYVLVQNCTSTQT